MDITIVSAIKLSRFHRARFGGTTFEDGLGAVGMASRDLTGAVFHPPKKIYGLGYPYHIYIYTYIYIHYIYIYTIYIYTYVYTVCISIYVYVLISKVDYIINGTAPQLLVTKFITTSRYWSVTY